jgi:predicted permease
MQTLLQDLHYSLRQLIKSPGFTLTAVISLALGIGATTAVFSVIYAALMNPFPYPGADRIVRLSMVTKESAHDSQNLNGPQIEQLQRLPFLDSVLAMDYHAMKLTGRDFPENVTAVGLIANGFKDLGVPPLLGRGLLPSDAIAGQDPQPVAVLSYKFWRQHFLSDPDVLGKKLELDRKSYLVVGVVGPRFTWYSADVYLPLKLTPNPDLAFVVNVRLKPGVTHRSADAALQPFLERFAKDRPKHFPPSFKVQVEGLNDWVVRDMGATLYLLFGAVALLLAIGCGNVSILLLARGAARQHELAVRAAIGARRHRLIRQLLTESLLLAAVGALFGVLASYGILDIIKAVLPRYAFAPEVAITINLPVLCFGIIVSLATGVVFGLWPALQLSQTPIGHMLQSNARRVAGSIRGRRTHSALISGQIALTLLLLAGAGSAMEGFTRLMHAPLGYNPHNVLQVGIPIQENSYAQWAARAAYFESLRRKVAETPGVTAAAISANATPPRNGFNFRFELLGKPAAEAPMASMNLVSPEYFAVLQIPLLQGRLWSEMENHSGAHVVVVNRAFAQRYFPDRDVIGHSLKLPDMEDRPPLILSVPQLPESWLVIVGVVENAINDGLRSPIKAAVFLPYTLTMFQRTQILLRSPTSVLNLQQTVRKQISAVNPEQQTLVPQDLETWVSEEPEWQQEHLTAWIFGIFAGLALALAAVGLYSVVSYTVAHRTNEFGIRMALGAQWAHVVRIVFASTLVSVGSGLLAGLVLVLALNKIVGVRDPFILLAGILILSLVSAIACFIPARRASQLDPMLALRSD